MLSISWLTLTQSAMVWTALITLLFLGSLFLPGRRAKGGRNADGEQPVYIINGLRLFLITVFIAAFGQILGGVSLSWVYYHFAALFVVANVFAFAVTVAVYMKAKQPASITGGIQTTVKGLFFGVALNPVWFGVDLKLFSYRPSLIILALFNLAFAVAQYEIHGRLSTAMFVYQVFGFIYVLNYFQFEYGMLFTWDIVAEHFGWMLIWGDYVLVPFFYSICGWYLVDNLTPLPVWCVSALIALFVFGMWMFRGANEQKHRFKSNPNMSIWGKPAQALDGRLLVSGFWGIGRHLNYTGEICIYCAIAATTGSLSLIPYLLPAWLIILLGHRAWRDDQRCSAKYGQIWDRYKQCARFRMVPFLY